MTATAGSTAVGLAGEGEGREAVADVIQVGVFGSRGRMGAEVCRAIEAADGLKLVAALDLGDDRAVAETARVMVDFTHPDAVLDNLSWCIEHGIHAVVGTTGFTEQKLDRLRGMLSGRPELGVLVAANFSIGAVLMMHFAEQAARFYESVEILELHHPDKADAPSGTAAATARRVAAAREAAQLPPPPAPPRTCRHHRMPRCRNWPGPAVRRSRGSGSTAYGCAASSPTRRCCSARLERP